jgi:hypothetical protein
MLMPMKTNKIPTTTTPTTPTATMILAILVVAMYTPKTTFSTPYPAMP